MLFLVEIYFCELVFASNIYHVNIDFVINIGIIFRLAEHRQARNVNALRSNEN